MLWRLLPQLGFGYTTRINCLVDDMTGNYSLSLSIFQAVKMVQVLLCPGLDSKTLGSRAHSYVLWNAKVEVRELHNPTR